MIDFIKTYLIAIVVFFAIDIIWLAVIAKDLYQQQIGFIMAPSPNWIAAIAFYLIFIFGLVFFVIQPGIQSQNLLETLIRGMLFGFITYATYDLTNLATLKDWPLKITIIDLIWGASLGGSVSVVTYFLHNLISK
jgi:uncharacterized membrane protein